MKIMTCPVNGARAISEFVCGGELREMLDQQTASDSQWSNYVFNRDSVRAIKKEWWCHVPSGVWFIAERDTGNDIVQRTYLYQSGRTG